MHEWCIEAEGFLKQAYFPERVCDFSKKIPVIMETGALGIVFWIQPFKMMLAGVSACALSLGLIDEFTYQCFVLLFISHSQSEKT